MSLIPSRRRGTDITWSLPLYDGATPVALSSLVDYKIQLVYFVGKERRVWLTYKKTPGAGELEIFEANSNTMRIVLPHDKTNTAPLGEISAQVEVIKPDITGGYPSNQNWITILDANTRKDLHPICRMEAAAV